MVYVEPGGGWGNNTETAQLTASDGTSGDNLGYSACISGSVVLAGAIGAEIGTNTEQGAVYVFEKPGGGWSNETQNAKITSSDGAGGDNFGLSVSLDGATGAVGAPFKPVSSESQAGEGYVFGTT